MKIAILLATLAVLATPAIAADGKKPPVDRAAALARAPQFHDQIEAALTKKPNDLYLAALTGSANDQWAWGLALVVKRFDTASVPPAQLATFKAYSDKVNAARDAYEKKHPKEDVSEKPMDFFVQPTPDEAQAVTLVHAINNAKDWLERALRGGADGATLNQSVTCLENVESSLDADSLMEQLIGAVGSEGAAKPDGKTGTKSSDKAVSLAEIMNAPKADADKSDEELDGEALCGGSDAFQHVKSLMKAVYTSPIWVTVSTDKKK
jgi:hypothetical protein